MKWYTHKPAIIALCVALLSCNENFDSRAEFTVTFVDEYGGSEVTPQIVKEGDTKTTRKGVVKASIYSLIISFLCIVVVLLLPKSLFGLVFGEEFLEVQQIVLFMSPGILAIAFYNVYGHYFAAIGKMKILVFKSVVGVLITLLLSIILVPMWEMNGASVTNSIVHIVCATIVIFYFFRKKIK